MRAAELKNRLSHYHRIVQQGEAVQVTDRGAVVAELRVIRVAARSDEACLHALAEQGGLTVGARKLAAFEPAHAGGAKRRRLSDMVIEDRG